MPDPKKPAHDAIGALFDLSADEDHTFEEAEAELRAAGVDVEGFLGRLKVRLDTQADEQRLSWRADARRAIASSAAPREVRNYKDLDRAALLARAQERQAQVGFHKLQEQTDDDLRTMLMDLDELADDKDPT